ncbi:recombinase family protein [Rhodococcus opacus]|uniref:recombinase family protein n=1 Tax=Rhodococcus opacus TaxID=37919 RepID=UPI001C441BC4|nr:recombinase family protein [Rhodococcus opacus]MBV6763057.1 recombinase family protein [Rhodococcus opacus]
MTAPRKRRRPVAPAGTAVGYIRCSTEEQALSGLGMDAQRAAILEGAARKGWTIVEWHVEAAVSGKVQVLDRPVFPLALAALDEGRAERLVVARLDRLGRDAGDVLNLDRDHPGAIYMCDRDLDTSNSNDRLQLVVMAGVAENERHKISERTRAALAAKKARGERLGRPQDLPDTVVRRVLDQRAGGYTLQAIADGLIADGIPTARGGRWQPGTVRHVLKSQRAAELTTEVTP